MLHCVAVVVCPGADAAAAANCIVMKHAFAHEASAIAAATVSASSPATTTTTTATSDVANMRECCEITRLPLRINY